MSTILKALRRLEQEKAAAEEPRPLREQIASAPHSDRGERRRGWLAAVMALVLGVGAGGGAIWWLFGGTGTGTDAVVAAAPAVPPPVASVALPPAAPPLEQPAPEPAPGPPDQAFASDVQTVDRPEALPRLVDADPVAPSETLPQPGSRRPVQSSSAAARAREAALAEMAAAETARLQPLPEAVAAPPVALAAEAAPAPPAPIAAARAEAPPPAPVAPKPAPQQLEAERSAPPPSEPPQIAARTAAEPPPPEAPALEVEKTQWHPLADRRIAWLRVPGESEQRRVVEGDVVEGMLVAKIEPSGVVFEHNGEQVHRGLGKR